MPTIFISHSTSDRKCVERDLLPLLQKNGFRPWYSSRDIPSATDWEAEIRAALEKTDWFLVVISPAAVQSEWVRAEVHWALEHKKGRVLPILIRDCNLADIHLRLIQLQHIDFRQKDPVACAKLIALLRGNGYSRPDQSALSMAATVSGARRELRVRIEITEGPEKGTRYELTLGAACIIGRQRGAVVLRLTDEEVSRQHATLAVNDNLELCLEDRQSANGTTLNDVPLTGRTVVHAGDLIGIGQSVLRVDSVS